MPRKRSTYTAEFKLAAVRMITDQKLAVAEVARRLDVGENLLRTWKKAFEECGNDAFPGHGNPSPADDELRRLRAENARLKAERDLLPLSDCPICVVRPTSGSGSRSRRRPAAAGGASAGSSPAGSSPRSTGPTSPGRRSAAGTA
jgi:transposase